MPWLGRRRKEGRKVYLYTRTSSTCLQRKLIDIMASKNNWRVGNCNDSVRWQEKMLQRCWWVRLLPGRAPLRLASVSDSNFGKMRISTGGPGKATILPSKWWRVAYLLPFGQNGHLDTPYSPEIRARKQPRRTWTRPKSMRSRRPDKDYIFMCVHQRALDPM